MSAGREANPVDAILCAAKWAESADRHPAAADVKATGPILRAIAARVTSGDLDVSDMPDNLREGPWSTMLSYLVTKGVDVIAMLNAKAVKP